MKTSTPAIRKCGVIVSRRVFDEYVRQLSERVGFKVESSDFTSVRDTGHGKHIKRRRMPVAKLELEIEHRWQTGMYCFAVESGGTIYTKQQIAANYDNGVITQTIEQLDPGPHYWGPGDTPHTCAALSNTTDEELGFDYGGFIDEDPPSYSGALDADDLLSLVTGLVESAGAPTVAQSWSWRDDVGPPIGITQLLGSWSDDGLPLTTRTVTSYRYRWRNTGSLALHLEWDQGGSSQAADLARGAVSSWYVDTIPATEGVQDEINSVVVSLA